MSRWLFLFLIVAVVEIYAFQAFRTITKVKSYQFIYVILNVVAIIYIINGFFHFDRSVGQTKQSLLTIGLLLLMFVPKLLITFVMIFEDIYRVFSGTITRFLGDRDYGSFLPERRKFVSQIAYGLAAIPFVSFLYGMTYGKYNFKVIKQTLTFDDLPESFDGFTLAQISDIHSGSFDNPDKIKYAVDLINKQKFDLLLFTGDIVNTDATEMHPWIDTFRELKNPTFGKYSILGNHDYGTYKNWPSDKALEDNFEAVKDLHRQIDFKLLLNENVKIQKDNQEIALVGVENWGRHFGEKGDINKASENLNKEDFKILMSHDPSHWEYVVKNHEKHFHLTLSGHTHGFQFGIEIPGIVKWSPVQYVYKQWAGLYENLGKYVYVNRGFGFHAYPGRVGIWPEITIIELKKGKKVA
ncbi:metallophosphoesterase [Flavobacterium capsici]|uniref:Metallophosphoesterase n=1 Tax=Flavobacterium capsici TaxID=3075618 RepID=A0AA96F0M4_9FLAO|nr:MULTISPECIES: metallophosphoesterase [unclassified Flavobacterium]WNM19364.1 metallophosphoesterase [Flavobacterium sp. PMR2A8]WNM20753.1 metallophosphoesterase [Flavobacterium sp. PMTSA4]